MKNFLLLVMTIALSIGSMFAQPDKSDKALWKSAKKAAKELKKQGWNTEGVEPLENLIYYHIQKTKAKKLEVIGLVEGNTDVTTMNQAKQWAFANAAMSYAQQAGSNIKGFAKNKISAGLADYDDAIDEFTQNFKIEVEKAIDGELRLDFGIFKKKKDGTIDYRAYYVVDEDAALNAKKKALKNAAKLSEYARDNFEQLEGFITSDKKE